MPASHMLPSISTAAASSSSSSPSSSDSSFHSEHAAQSPDRQRTTFTGISKLASNALLPESSKTEVLSIEPEKHPKGKRKRTAAKDKTILENAYLANPKPDKAARLDIVKRVSLNEKEVQIWFQNRRQNDRRKSRPLSAQEIAALRYGGMQILSSDPVAYSSSVAEDKTSPVAQTATPTISVASETPLKPIASKTGDLVGGSQNISPPKAVNNTRNNAFETPLSQISVPGSQAHSASFSISSSAGFLSKRWNTSSPFSTQPTQNHRADGTSKLDKCLSSSSSAEPTVPILPHPQSHVRLSLSLEGKAELVSNDASPPRLQTTKIFSDLPNLPQVRTRSFQRSHSALPSVTLPPISALTDSLPPSLGRGRSRDAHAWELCCDADSHDELTAQAENESNGSAVAAISLLRSTSSILQNNNSKRNSPASRPTSRPQQAKKPRLSRTSSSLARMQTSLDSEKAISRPTDENQSRANVLISPSGDSDKENWCPDDEGNPHEMPLTNEFRRPLPITGVSRLNPRRTGWILQDHPGPVIMSGNRAKTMPAMGRRDSGKDLSIFEDGEELPAPEATDEVERFMQGEVSPSKKGDMDCIAGLLSLSQGNWR